MKNVVCFSGGKDSTAMLLMMIEKGYEIDEILFCDTGIEFPDMYKHIEKIEKYINKSITILKAENTFEYMLFEHEKKKGKNKGQYGYDWPGPLSRWCTRYFKQNVMKKYLKEKYKNEEVIQFVGIAFDEQERIKKNKSFKNLRYPLVEWSITEEVALKYCYRKGFDWNNLYKKFNRVSCWCCPLQPLKSLRTLYEEFPELWEKLKEWDNKARRSFKPSYSVVKLEEKFKKERKSNEKGSYTI